MIGELIQMKNKACFCKSKALEKINRVWILNVFVSISILQQNPCNTSEILKILTEPFVPDVFCCTVLITVVNNPVMPPKGQLHML